MSKVIYSEVRRKFDSSKINLTALDKLPKGSISIAATVQYIDLIPIIQKHLEHLGHSVFLKKGAYYCGHVLGCNSSAFDLKSDLFLLLCDGKFHAINNAIQLNREIYVFDLQNLDKIEKTDLDKYKMKLEAKKKKYLMSSNIGILVSTKFGQNFKEINLLKKRLKKSGKNIYIFEGDNLNPSEFENYPNIGIYVNTACFGLAVDDSRIVNLNDILDFC